MSKRVYLSKNPYQTTQEEHTPVSIRIQLTFRTPRMAIHLFSRGHFSHAQHTPTVLCCHRMRGETPNAFASGAWYGARATAYRSVPGPTSAHCEGLCRQDWFG